MRIGTLLALWGIAGWMWLGKADERVGKAVFRVQKADGASAIIEPILPATFHIRRLGGTERTLPLEIMTCEVHSRIFVVNEQNSTVVNGTVLNCGGTEFVVDGVLFTEAK